MPEIIIVGDLIGAKYPRNSTTNKKNSSFELKIGQISKDIEKLKI